MYPFHEVEGDEEHFVAGTHEEQGALFVNV